MSHVMFHVFCVTFFLFSFFFAQCVGASWWRVCYQQGLHIKLLKCRGEANLDSNLLKYCLLKSEKNWEFCKTQLKGSSFHT